MRAVAIQRFGDPDGLAVVDIPSPQPGPGELRVQTEAIGVGGVDAVIRRGTLGGYGFSEGMILGREVAGIVTATGPGVDPSWVGRRVWAFTGDGGAYLEQAIAPVSNVTELPANLSPIDAVALGSAATVAHFALTHAHLAAGESVLVRGAAGSIGIAAVELAAQAGAGQIAVTTSSAARGERLRALGATHVLDRSGTGDPSAPALYDVILDIIGGPDLTGFIDRLAPNGRLVAVGVVAGMPPADFGMRLMATFQQSRSFATFSLDTIPATARAAVRAEHFVAATKGELHAIVHEVLPLAQAAEAHRQMDAGHVFGRIVLTP